MLRDQLIKRYGSLKSASRKFRVSPSFLSMVLRGKRKPPMKLVLELENEGFDVTELEYFFKGVDVPPEVKPDDYVFLILHYKKLIIRQDLLLQAEQMKNLNLRNDLSRLRDKYNSLKRKLT